MTTKFISIQEAIKQGKGKVAVRGWIFRERGSNKMKFIVLRDSTEIIQCVLNRGGFEKQWEDIDKLQIEASLEIEGLGAKGIQEIRKALGEFGITLK